MRIKIDSKKLQTAFTAIACLLKGLEISFVSSSALIPSTSSARSLPLEMLSFLASCFSFTCFLDLDLVLEEAVRRMFSTPAVSLHH